MSDAYPWLVLAAVPGVGPVTLQRLLEHASAQELISLSPCDAKAIGFNDKQIKALCSPNTSHIEKTLVACEEQGVAVLGFDSPYYPSLLQQIPDPPPVLFVKGNMRALCLPQLAIVGSRKASCSGREIAFQLAAEVAVNGLAVTSGMALGIDGKAHAGALNVGGKTVAVLGCGVNKVYPQRHANLYDDILTKGGCIVSEYGLNSAPRADNFPRRNRIISGLSQGVLVIQANVKSGSLITARLALEQGREVFAVPGSMHDPLHKGCHHLIKQGAKLVESAADILDELGLLIEPEVEQKNEIHTQKKSTPDLCEDQLLASVDFEATAIDTVVSRSELPVEVVLARMINMELRGLVRAVPGGYQKQRRS